MDDSRETLRPIFLNALAANLAHVPQGDKDRISKRLTEMRAYAIGRHDYYDRLRTQFVAFAAALLPLTVGVVTLFYTATRDAPVVPMRLKIGCAVACSGLLLAGCYVVLKFAVGFSPKFAYRKVARILSWFYAYTPTHAFEDEFFLGDGDAARARQKFSEGLRDYGTEWLALASNIDSTIIEDLEQTFILFGLQKYRRDEAASFAQSLAAGLGIAVVGAMLMASEILWP